MKFLAIVSLATSLFFSAQFAHAVDTDSCGKFKTSYDKTYCVAKLFLESDKELNAVYTELRKPLKEEIKQQLTGTQREWIKYRDASCERTGSINVSCNYELNQARAEYLRDRVRECKTGNCNDVAIVKKSWE